MFAASFSLITVAADPKPLHFFESKYGSESVTVNSDGMVAGDRSFYEVIGGLGHYLTEPVFWDGIQKNYDAIPDLEGYTYSFVNGISPKGLVVGRAARATAPPSQAYLWSKASGIVGLEFPPGGYTASSAEAIAETRAVGWSSGENLALSACVWTATTANGRYEWKADLLPVVAPAIPAGGAQGSQARAISSDGKWVGGHENGRPVIWHEVDGVWVRNQIADDEGYVQGINNQGDAVGRSPYVFTDANGEIHSSTKAFYFSSLKNENLELGKTTKGHEGSSAVAISDDGVIVGNSLAPHHGDGANDGFIYRLKDAKLIRIRVNPENYIPIYEEVPEALLDDDLETQSLILSDIADGGLVSGHTAQTENTIEDWTPMQMFTLVLP